MAIDRDHPADRLEFRAIGLRTTWPLQFSRCVA
jgi:hypothetical protein